MKNMLKLLSEHPVFANLDGEELQQLSSIVDRRIFLKGEIVFDTNNKPEFLFYIENGSFILALSNNEYKTLRTGELIGEIGVINEDFRSGIVYAAEQSSAISICGTRLFNEKFIPSPLALKIVRSLSKKITSYLRSKEQISTLELIQKGENESVEFKSTLRWNLYTDKKDKAIEKAVLKTLAAFMNSNGGILIVGVDDDGKILGLENDHFEDDDKLLLHLTGIIKERLGAILLKYLHFSLELISEKKILRIDCSPAGLPVYFSDDNSDHFFIRSGPSTTDLRLSKVFNYITDRFDKK